MIFLCGRSIFNKQFHSIRTICQIDQINKAATIEITISIAVRIHISFSVNIRAHFNHVVHYIQNVPISFLRHDFGCNESQRG
ncbi:hypothetical protein DF40_009220 [Stenotrophomonas maltophilia M30]|nr:hypothetical protein DF40_009220 [Stenotrophomonas maltophilia M30]